MKHTSVLNNEKGYIKLILVIAFIVVSFYVGLKFGGPYYRYSAFKSDVRETARISVGDLNKTKTDIMQRAQELKIPIREEELTIEKKGDIVHVNTSWSETVDLMGFYQKTLDFTVDVEE